MKLKKNLVLKLDSYRKHIRHLKLISFYQNKIYLICHLIYFSGFSLNS